jgi:hypothetical protein
MCMLKVVTSYSEDVENEVVLMLELVFTFRVIRYLKIKESESGS